MKKLPKKYRGHGLHIWCSSCKKTVTNHPCRHHESHRYQSRIWNKLTKSTNIIKTWPSTDVNAVFIDHMDYKKSVISGSYILQRKSATTISRPQLPYYLKDAIHMYFDYLEDINVPSHEKKSLDRHHIESQVRYMTRFYKSLGNPSLSIYDVDESYVSKYYQWISDQDFKARSFNAHILSVRTFYNWAIKQHGLDMINPFLKIKRKYEVYDPKIITEDELTTLFSAITYQNGWTMQGGKRINRCYPWLKHAFRLALLTGERSDGIFYMKWKHVNDNYIKIENFKINKKFGVEKYRYCPITTDLATLLMELKPDDPEQYLIAPDRPNRETLKSMNSKAFTHFWRLTGIEKEISFRHFRKTYITRAKVILGDSIKGLEIHSNDETTMNHYLERTEITKKLVGVPLFTLDYGVK